MMNLDLNTGAQPLKPWDRIHPTRGIGEIENTLKELAPAAYEVYKMYKIDPNCGEVQGQTITQRVKLYKLIQTVLGLEDAKKLIGEFPDFEESMGIEH